MNRPKQERMAAGSLTHLDCEALNPAAEEGKLCAERGVFHIRHEGKSLLIAISFQGFR